MKKVFVVLFVLCIIICPVVCDDLKDVIDIYDTELIKIGYQTMGGITLTFNGQTTSTSMGISANFQNILSEYNESKYLMNSYKKKNLLGNVFLYGGLLASIGGSYYPLLTMDEYDLYDNSKFKTGMYIALGGLVSAVIGSILLPSSYQDLFNSVNSYNRSKIMEYYE